MKKYILTIFSLIISLVSSAQAEQVEMADELRNSGKIYVVVAVMAAIFIVLAVYLFSIDRKVKKLEGFERNK